jgi:CBS domain-containing protein
MKTASDNMTPSPACCAPDTPLEAVAKLMVQHNCGEIPVVDAEGELIAVVTDRDIVCRVVATGKNPRDHTVQDCMSQPAITVHPDTALTDVLATMECHQIRRVPVVDDHERCLASLRRRISRGPAAERGRCAREGSLA